MAESLSLALVHMIEAHADGLRAVDCWRALGEPRPTPLTVWKALRRLCERKILVQIPGKRYVVHQAFRAAFS